MFKVLIIDDEEPVRKAIKILSEWDKLDVREIFEACNGKSGIRLMNEEKPDIVLIDMKMPEMDGIEFLQAIERDYPNTCYIVISGYNNFEYTRQAIKSKAVDYLLKPINKTELNTALLKAVDSIKEQRQKLKDTIDRNLKLNMSINSLKEKLFITVIEGSFSKHDEETYLKVVDFSGDKKLYGIALLKILNMDEVNKWYFENFRLLCFALTNVIDEICNQVLQSFSIRNPKVENEIIIILTYEGSSCEKASNLSCDLMKKVTSKLKNLFGAASLTAIGGFYSDFALLKDSFESAETFLYDMNLLEMRETVACGDCCRPAGVNHSILNIKNLIKNAIEIGSLDYAKNLIDDHLKGILETGCFSLREANKIIHEVVLMMSDIALEKGVPDKEILKNFESSINSNTTTFYFSNVENYRNLLYDIISHFYDKIRQFIKFIEKFNIHEIKDYIDSNYIEEIKMSMFTEKYYLSRQYLTKLFKKEYGYSIYEYALKVRMEKAKELMNDPKIKIQSVAEMLNYSDNNYFSKAFKNYFGISPSDYRLNILNQELNCKIEHK